jgi:hypothetical protein
MSKSIAFILANLMVSAALVETQAIAQTAPPASQTPPAAKAATPPAPAKDQEIDDVVKDFKKMPGVFTFYRQKKGTSDTLYLEIPESMLDHWLLLQATASSGTMNTPVGVFQGAPLNDLAFKIKIVDDGRVQMISPAIENRAPDSPEAQRALDREFAPEVLYSFDIKARQASRKSILIDVSALFKSDVASLSDNLKFAGMGYGIDASSSYLDSIKVLPDNAVVRTTYRLMWQGPNLGAPKSIPFSVSYNLSTLPDDGYKPRISDARVGYFTTNYLDQSDAKNADPRTNFIYRWNLQKADPSLALSPPKKPIVFYIDNAMPKEYRPAATEGLLAWNKAFEKVGIKDAVVVKQMPDDADWDIADVRYNVVRWTVNVPFAIALMRVNPLSGEVVNASINFDSGFAASGAQYDDSFNDVGEPAQAKPIFNYSKSVACIYPKESALNNGFASAVIEATQGESKAEKDRLIYEYIREVACHEMGHCLGLRHNFIASTFLTTKQLADGGTVAREGITASVMDYNPENLSAIGHKDVGYYSGVVGRYDKWAIEYGYTPIDSQTPKGELYKLRAIATRTNEPGLAYQTDEMADNWDPEVRRFDLSKNPLDWCEQTSAIATAALAKVVKKHPAPGESYFEFTRRFNLLRSQAILTPVSYATTFIGGNTVSSNYHGDPGEKKPIGVTPAADQLRALKFVCKLELSEDSPGIPPSISSMLSANPNSAGNQPSPVARLFPVLDRVSAEQGLAMDRLFAYDRLNRMVNNQYRTTDTLPLATLFETVKHSVWTELADGKEISPTRRNLQRRHLQWLSLVVLRKVNAPGDAVALANAELHDLEPSLSAAYAKRKDPMQRAHLLDCLTQVHRALQAQTTTE